MGALERLRWLTPAGVAELGRGCSHRLARAWWRRWVRRQARRQLAARLVHEYQRELAYGPRPPKRPLS